MATNSRPETQIATTYAREGDTEIISWAKNIVTIVILERTRGVTECAQDILEEALGMKAMERDTAKDVVSYLPVEEMTKTALINISRDR